MNGPESLLAPSREPILLAPSSWTWSFQNCETIGLCCLSHPVWRPLLGQPEQTNILTLLHFEGRDFPGQAVISSPYKCWFPYGSSALCLQPIRPQLQVCGHQSGLPCLTIPGQLFLSTALEKPFQMQKSGHPPLVFKFNLVPCSQHLVNIYTYIFNIQFGLSSRCVYFHGKWHFFWSPHTSLFLII